MTDQVADPQLSGEVGSNCAKFEKEEKGKWYRKKQIFAVERRGRFKPRKIRKGGREQMAEGQSSSIWRWGRFKLR